MKTRFLIPVIFALAVHAVFLIGLKPEKPTRRPAPAAATDEPRVRRQADSPTAMSLELAPPSAEAGERNATSLPPVSPRAELRREDFVSPAHPKTDATGKPVAAPVRLNIDDGERIKPDWRVRSEVAENSPEVREWLDNLAARYGEVQTADQLDKIPDTRRRAGPVLPPGVPPPAQDLMVWVTFLINRQGEVVEAKADDDAPPVYARAAEDAVKRWRFDPGTQKGKPVVFRMTAPVVFSAKGN